MGWLDQIRTVDGLEEETENRIVSYTNGDDFIQLSGFFLPIEIVMLATFLTDRMRQPQSAQSQQGHPQSEQHQ